MRRRLRRVVLLVVHTARAIGGGRTKPTKPDAPRCRRVFQNLFGPNGLVVDSEAVLPDGSTHSAHFNSAFQSNFTQFNVALASQLTSLPLPSPASGFTYRFDQGTGTFIRSTQSFGPILTDRAETIGRGRFSFGYTYQFFSFDQLEGIDLSRVPSVFTHDDFQLGGGRTDVVTTRNTIDASVGQWTGALTYGLTDRLDLSVAVPIVSTHLEVISAATIERVGTVGSPNVHFFADPDAPGGFGSERTFSAGGSASGIGDIIMRLKGGLLRSAGSGLSVGMDVRAPTGDEHNLLGSGAAGVKPFVAASWTLKRFAPRVNLGYQWNGSSVLAGDPETGRKADLPDQVLYAAWRGLRRERSVQSDWGLVGTLCDRFTARQRPHVHAGGIAGRIRRHHTFGTSSVLGIECGAWVQGERRRTGADRLQSPLHRRQQRPDGSRDAAHRGRIRIQVMAAWHMGPQFSRSSIHARA